MQGRKIETSMLEKEKVQQIKNPVMLPFQHLLLITLLLLAYVTANVAYAQPTPTGIDSDDFQASLLDTSVWTYIDPLSDGTLSMTGTQLELTAPAGAIHDIWTNGSIVPRVMQAVNDTDFELEVKFESALTIDGDFESQGILVEADSDDLLRLEFHCYQGSIRLYAASFLGGVPQTRIFEIISLGALDVPNFLRVTRVADQWTLAYSSDGVLWTTGGSFSHALAVTAIGIYVGSGENAAHRAVVDYVIDTVMPPPEDEGASGGPHTLTVQVAGSGSVTQVPDEASYADGTEVTLTATPDAGDQFQGWSGAVVSSAPSVTVRLHTDLDVTASFTTGGGGDTVPPVISAVQVQAGGTSATVSWTTDEAATSVVDYGETTAYGFNASDVTLVTLHNVQLTGLQAGTLYHYQITSVDGAGNAGSTANATFTTISGGGINSDDFQASTLDTSVWTYINPLGDGTLSMTGTQLELTAPAGAIHDIWTNGNFVPRVMQAVNDTDFELEAKFESALTSGGDFQGQGVLIEADSDDLLRLEFHTTGDGTKLYAASFLGGVPQTRILEAINIGVPNYLRVTRVADQWTLAYSSDGVLWTTGGSFSHALAVTAIGVYVGGGENAAHRAVVDYVIDTATPPPGDEGASSGPHTLTVQVAGSGSVTRVPDAASYANGTEVTLTATPDAGAQFHGWSGSVVSSAPSVTVRLRADLDVTATFNPTRIDTGLVVLYDFVQGADATQVYDVSGVFPALDLTIADPGAVTWNPGGGLSIDSSTVIWSLGAATKVIDAVQTSDALTIEAWMQPANLTQEGPARIVTLSEGSSSVSNFMLGEGRWGSLPSDVIDVRLWTTTTPPSITTDAGSLTANLTHVVYTRDAAGEAAVYIDGSLAASGTMAGDLSIWDNSYPLVLGNEAGGDRPWLGELHLVAIFDQALDSAQVAQNYAAGPTVTPPDPVPPSIDVQPQNQTVVTGQTGTFNVVASGTAPLSYQWQQGNGAAWADISGVTGAAYTTPATTLPDNGTEFRCVVTNSEGSVTSNAATLTVIAPINPAIDLEILPEAQVVNYGDDVNFTLTVLNSGDVELSNVTLTDAVCDSLILADDGNGDAILAVTELWSYTCTVNNATADFVNSASVDGEDPTGGTVSDNDTASVTVSGGASRINTGLVVLYDFVQGADATQVYDVSGVFPTLDLTIADPDAVTWNTGGGLSIDSSMVIASAGAATKVIDAVQASDALTIEAWMQPANLTQEGPARIVTLSEGSSSVSNFMLGEGRWGSLPSDVIDVRLWTTTTPPSITTDAGSLTANLTHVVYTRDAAGEAAIYIDGSLAASGTMAGDLSIWDDSYPLVLGNEAGGDRPWLGELHLVAIFDQALDSTQVAQNYAAGPIVTPPDPVAPSIDVQPQNQTVVTGQTGTFNVVASGTAPLSYQWQQGNGAAWADIAGATGAAYTTPATTLPDNGTEFRCVVTNTEGSVTSNAATLTVIAPINPAIDLEILPETQVVSFGDDVNFTLTVLNSGDVELSNVTLTDAICDSLILADDGDGDAILAATELWSYTCTVNNATADFVNSASVDGEDPTGGTVSDNDTASVTVSEESTFPTVIDVWYGTDQPFGYLGVPQQWINILGNVSDLDGIASLTYSLNGGPQQPLSIGPDTRRLAFEGDFNVEIDWIDLVDGLNDLIITATDTLNNTAVENVTIDFTPNVWPTTYSIDWDSVSNIQDVIQIVDGKWELVPDGIRIEEVDYDRVLAIGDLAWADYEIMVPFTMHAIDPSGFEWPSVSPGFGITFRWTGHTDDPAVCSQPHCGWLPSGAGGWYDAGNDGPLLLSGSQDPNVFLDFDVRYIWKMRVETTQDGSLYAMKVWEDGQNEPPIWNITRLRTSDVANGSLILIAHHVDITFGNITIVPVINNDPPVLSNIQAIAGETTATVTWTTNKPATSTVDYGVDQTYGESVTDNSLVTSHSINLSNLSPGTLYHYQVTSVDGNGNPATSQDLIFNTSGGPDQSGIVSDDFSLLQLDTAIWTFIDPLGDGTFNLTGTQLELTAPAGAIHDIWTNGSIVPRVMQAANDTDFELEVKFDSALTGGDYKSHGILVEADSDNMLRLEFHVYQGNMKLYAASFTNLVPSTRIFKTISIGVPNYLRVTRVGDQWTLAYSSDGVAWTSGGSFAHSLQVTSVGVYVGGGEDSLYTAVVDHAFNTAAPIEPQD